MMMILCLGIDWCKWTNEENLFSFHSRRFFHEKIKVFSREIFIDFALYRRYTQPTNGIQVCVLSSSFATSVVPRTHTSLISFSKMFRLLVVVFALIAFAHGKSPIIFLFKIISWSLQHKIVKHRRLQLFHIPPEMRD